MNLIKSWSLAVGKALTGDAIASDAVQLAGPQCSSFVADVVLPRLARSQASKFSPEEADLKLTNWLAMLGNNVTSIHDVTVGRSPRTSCCFRVFALLGPK